MELLYTSLEDCTLSCVWLGPLTHEKYNNIPWLKKKCTILATPNNASMPPFLLEGLWQTVSTDADSTHFALSEADYQSERTDIHANYYRETTHPRNLNIFRMQYSTANNTMLMIEHLPNNIPNTIEDVNKIIPTYIAQNTAYLHHLDNPIDNLVTFLRHTINLVYPQYTQQKLYLLDNHIYKESPLINEIEETKILNVDGIPDELNNMYLPEPHGTYEDNSETWEYESTDNDKTYCTRHALIRTKYMCILIPPAEPKSQHAMIEEYRNLKNTYSGITLTPYQDIT